MLERLGWDWNDFAGHDGDDGLRDGQVGMRVSGNRRDLCRQIAAGRMADQREPGWVRADVPDSGRQDPERVANRRDGIRQEILRVRADVVLIARKDHDLSIADQMVDPGAVEPRIDGEPAVEENDDRCAFVGLGIVRLEDPVRLAAPRRSRYRLNDLWGDFSSGVCDPGGGRLLGLNRLREERPASPRLRTPR